MRNKADITNINNKAPITGIAGVTCSARYGQLEKKENYCPEIPFGVCVYIYINFSTID